MELTNYKQILEEKTREVFSKLNLPDKYSVVSFSNLPKVCDYQCTAPFGIAKEQQMNPQIIASKIIEELQPKIDFADVFFSQPGFINFKLNNLAFETLANQVFKSNDNGLKNIFNSKYIIMDYGGANIAKSLHVGHLRSPIIGEALKRLHLAFGDTVVSDAHLGDWGLQIGLTIAGLEKENYIKGYFNRGKNKEITFSVLNEIYPMASKLKDVDKQFFDKAQLYTLYVQQGKEPYVEIYKDLRKLSVSEIVKQYAELGVKFDLLNGESTCEKYIDETLNIFKDKNLSYESEGVIIVDVKQEGEHIELPKQNPDDPFEVVRYKNPCPPCVLQKSNGAVLYATTDIATILLRNKEKVADEILYLTDKRQELHFKQVFRCAKLSGISPENQVLTHIGFGTMNGKDGKAFKTRSGDTVKLDDVAKLLKEKAQEKLTSNGLENNPKLAIQIGVGALKFGDLSNIVSKDYVFDLEKFASFEGKTGPYIQYTCARINSLLNKAKNYVFNIKIYNDESRDIIINIIKLIESYKQAYIENSLHGICIALYNLASAYSTFYNNIKILTEPNPEKKQAYLSISVLVQQQLKFGLDILGIESPEQM